jgi:hypothetical protein
MAAHVPHAGVVIIGELPKWVAADTVTHIPTAQSSAKYGNARLNTMALLDAELGLERIVWCNDDFFALEDVEEVPLLHRGSLLEEIARRRGARLSTSTSTPYLAGLEASARILEKWGYPDPHDCAIHVPMPVLLSELEVMLEVAWAEEPTLGHWRTIYGAPRAATYMADPKITELTAGIPTGVPFVSTSDASWLHGRIGLELRARFWQPSPYEMAA